MLYQPCFVCDWMHVDEARGRMAYLLSVIIVFQFGCLLLLLPPWYLLQKAVFGL